MQYTSTILNDNLTVVKRRHYRSEDCKKMYFKTENNQIMKKYMKENCMTRRMYTKKDAKTSD